MSATKPEAMRQAQSWDAAKSFYLRAGLCNGCAARIAWGMQQGFRQVFPPCADCLPITLSFPRNEVGEWRSVPRQLWREWLNKNGRDLAPVFLAPPESAFEQLHPQDAGAAFITAGTLREQRPALAVTAA